VVKGGNESGARELDARGQSTEGVTGDGFRGRARKRAENIKGGGGSLAEKKGAGRRRTVYWTDVNINDNWCETVDRDERRGRVKLWEGCWSQKMLVHMARGDSSFG